MDFRHFNVQKFNGHNFQLWKYQMEIIFRAETGMLEVVDKTTARPGTAGDSQKAWDSLNIKAMLLISSGMEFEQLQTVVNCPTAPQMWTRLKAIHEQRSSINKVTLKQNFFSYQMSETDNIAQHISKIDTMAQALNDVGEKVSDTDKIAKALGSLPLKYNAFATAWDSYDESKQTYDNLTSRLLKEEQRLTQSEEMAGAFASLRVNKRYQKRGTAAEKSSSGTQKIQKDKRNIECCYYRSECRATLAKQNQSQDINKHTALCVEYKNVAASTDDNEWLGDSAASKHMSFRREWFTMFRKIEKNTVTVQIGDDSEIQVEGIGSIEVLALVNKEWEPRTIEDVYYIPDLKKNLFSVGAVTSKQMKVIFEGNKMEVYSDRLIVSGVKQANQCYKMLLKPNTNIQANVSTENLIMLWHERMGHVNFRTLKEMSDSGQIPRLHIKDIKELFCETCQYGKLHRLPFHKNVKSRAQKPGEFVHVDLSGKISHPSIGGASYFILFKDDCTSYRTVYFIKHKSDAFSKFCEYHKLIENQTGNKLKRLRSDNGTEFVNEQFKQYFKERGIIHEYSAPYTAEQNGRIERENRTIVEGARTMMIAGNLQPGLWAEAVNACLYTMNRRPRDLDRKVPYEMWTGKTVSFNHLRKFGAEVYIHIPKQLRGKFDSKAKKMFFVGYEGESSNYRVFDPKTMKIIITRDVVFNEKFYDNYYQTKEPQYLTFTMEEHNQEGIEEDDNQIVNEDNANAEHNNEEAEHVEDIAQNTERVLRDRSTLHPSPYYDNYVCAAIVLEEPQSFKQAMSSDDVEKWRKAMDEEILSLKLNETWTCSGKTQICH